MNTPLCSVCSAQSGNFAMVGADERLCMVSDETHAGCFAWFSGYPWVMFESGRLVSDLWDYEGRPWIYE